MISAVDNDSLVTNLNFTLGAGFDVGAAWK